MSKEIIKVVGGILIENNEIILIKRASHLKHFPNLYEFPGGKIEEIGNETNIEALKRELLEELKIEIDSKDVVEFNNNHKTIELETTIIDLTLYIVNSWKGVITLNPDINSEKMLVPIDKLHLVENLLPTDKKFITDIYQYYKQ